MAKFFESLLPEHAAFIARQKMFFIATQAPTGRINLSPKGLDSLRVLDDRTVAYIDLTGSGAETAAHLLWRDYRHLIEIEPPSFKTGGCWRLTNLGWAGYLPLTPALGISLQPKVALRTLLRMVEVAYDLGTFRLFEGWFNAQSIPELYELLALLLAQRVLNRCRQGLQRAGRHHTR